MQVRDLFVTTRESIFFFFFFFLGLFCKTVAARMTHSGSSSSPSSFSSSSSSSSCSPLLFSLLVLVILSVFPYLTAVAADSTPSNDILVESASTTTTTFLTTTIAAAAEEGIEEEEETERIVVPSSRPSLTQLQRRLQAQLEEQRREQRDKEREEERMRRESCWCTSAAFEREHSRTKTSLRDLEALREWTVHELKASYFLNFTFHDFPTTGRGIQALDHWEDLPSSSSPPPALSHFMRLPIPNGLTPDSTLLHPNLHNALQRFKDQLTNQLTTHYDDNNNYNSGGGDDGKGGKLSSEEAQRLEVVLDEKVWNMFRVVAVLLYEKSLCEKSRWWKYLRTIPTVSSLQLRTLLPLWSPREVRSLLSGTTSALHDYQSNHAFISAFRDYLKRFRRSTLSDGGGSGGDSDATQTTRGEGEGRGTKGIPVIFESKLDVLWAVVTLTSRSFHVSYKGDPLYPIFVPIAVLYPYSFVPTPRALLSLYIPPFSLSPPSPYLSL
jgi:hypothetical protein